MDLKYLHGTKIIMMMMMMILEAITITIPTTITYDPQIWTQSQGTRVRYTNLKNLGHGYGYSISSNIYL